MNLRELLDVLGSLDTIRRIDLEIGGVEVKGTVETQRHIEKEK